MQIPKTHWQLDFWKNDNGFCPVEDFLNDLRKSKKVEYIRVLKKLDRFRSWPPEVLRQKKYLEKVKNEEFWELRVSVGIEVRFFGKFTNSSEFVVFSVIHGIHKKDERIRKQDLDLIRQRLNK